MSLLRGADAIREGRMCRKQMVDVGEYFHRTRRCHRVRYILLSMYTRRSSLRRRTVDSSSQNSPLAETY